MGRTLRAKLRWRLGLPERPDWLAGAYHPVVRLDTTRVCRFAVPDEVLQCLRWRRDCAAQLAPRLCW